MSQKVSVTWGGVECCVSADKRVRTLIGARGNCFIFQAAFISLIGINYIINMAGPHTTLTLHEIN